jgi:hypothetical protein
MQQAIYTLIGRAAVTYESMRLALEGMRDLRRLATAAGAPPRLLNEIGRLCGGKYPAQPVLDCARNLLGFHWDYETVAAFLRGYRRNRALIGWRTPRSSQTRGTRWIRRSPRSSLRAGSN